MFVITIRNGLLYSVHGKSTVFAVDRDARTSDWEQFKKLLTQLPVSP